MTRVVLAFVMSAFVLVVGVLAAWVQSRNFARAADLDSLQLQSNWYQRCSSELREEIERFEFDPPSDEASTPGDVMWGEQ